MKKNFNKNYCKNCKEITENKKDNFFNKDNLKMTLYTCKNCDRVKFILYFSYNKSDYYKFIPS